VERTTSTEHAKIPPVRTPLIMGKIAGREHTSERGDSKGENESHGPSPNPLQGSEKEEPRPLRMHAQKAIRNGSGGKPLRLGRSAMHEAQKGVPFKKNWGCCHVDGARKKGLLSRTEIAKRTSPSRVERRTGATKEKAANQKRKTYALETVVRKERTPEGADLKPPQPANESCSESLNKKTKSGGADARRRPTRY